MNFGPFRLNLSKSGLGWSTGVRGFRFGTNAKGSKYAHASIPGTGIFWRSSGLFKEDEVTGPRAVVSPLRTIEIPDIRTPDSQAEFLQRFQLGRKQYYEALLWPILSLACWGALPFIPHPWIQQASWPLRLNLALLSGMMAAHVVSQLLGWLSLQANGKALMEQADQVRERIEKAEAEKLERWEGFFERLKEEKLDEALALFSEIQKSDSELEAFIREHPLRVAMLFSVIPSPHRKDLLKVYESIDEFAVEMGTCLLLAAEGRISEVNERLLPRIRARDHDSMERKSHVEYIYATALELAGHEDEALTRFRNVQRRTPGFADVEEKIRKLSKRKTRDEPESREEETRDPFQVLGLSRGATKSEVRSAYRHLMSQYHPDKVAHLGEEIRIVAEKKARDLTWAYEECLKSGAA